MNGNFVASLLGFSDKTVLVTGAGAGIGLETAKLFGMCGCRVILTDINQKSLDKAKAVMESSAGHVFLQADLSQKDSIEKLWQKLEFVPDVLVNNAGVYPSQDYLKLTTKELDKTLAINLNSVIWMCQEFINRRGKKGGVIVNVGSIEAILPFKQHLIPYSVSKAGVIALTRSLARDYGKQGIRANVVLPGAIKTPGTMSQVWNGLFHFRVDLMRVADVFQSRLALGRWGKPEEVAKVIVFLSSNMASYVQGAMVPVDGGFLSS